MHVLVLILTFVFSHDLVLAHGGKGNQRIASFSKAKKAMREVYKGNESSIYCGCTYNGSAVNLANCSFKPKKPKKKRSRRIEWEHLVPAKRFGDSFSEWKDGHQLCVDKKGKSFKGRNCARKLSVPFRLMESDLYNLAPAIGEVNAIRSHLPVTQLKNKTQNRIQGYCKTVISSDGIEPRDAAKGQVARAYLYMAKTYPHHVQLSPQEKSMFDSWHQKFPPSKEERKRSERITLQQGNSNPYY